MRILISRSTDGIVREVGEETYRQHLGILITPALGSTPRRAIEVGGIWAVDNGCFTGFEKDAFIQMLKSLRAYPGCKFVVAPDVVANATATLTRFNMWEPVLHYMGFPVAFVAQDGLENMPIPWERFETLFIGGSTHWKLSHHAAAIAQKAKARGKWLHMGRVNTNVRIDIARSIGCDSVDGTGYARYSKSELPPAIRTLKQSFTYSLWR
jgi:hypothetical protein